MRPARRSASASRHCQLLDGLCPVKGLRGKPGRPDADRSSCTPTRATTTSAAATTSADAGSPPGSPAAASRARNASAGTVGSSNAPSAGCSTTAGSPCATTQRPHHHGPGAPGLHPHLRQATTYYLPRPAADVLQRRLRPRGGDPPAVGSATAGTGCQLSVPRRRRTRGEPEWETQGCSTPVAEEAAGQRGGPPGDRTLNPRIKSRGAPVPPEPGS